MLSIFFCWNIANEILTRFFERKKRDKLLQNLFFVAVKNNTKDSTCRAKTINYICFWETSPIKYWLVISKEKQIPRFLLKNLFLLPPHHRFDTQKAQLGCIINHFHVWGRLIFTSLHSISLSSIVSTYWTLFSLITLLLNILSRRLYLL